jgi:hypothetical protein
MAMVCPKCNDAFEQRLHCPKCNVHLVYNMSAQHVKKVAENDSGGKWMQTAGGRLLLGVLLAQGLYFGLHRLLSAGLLAANDGGEMVGLWSSVFGVVLIQVLQAAGLLIGGAVAGAGFRRGTFLGMLVGVASGAISYFFRGSLDPEATTAVAVFGQPLLQAVFGAMGGFVGSTIWRPARIVEDPRKADLAKPKVGPPPKAGRARFRGPISWIRVLVGTALAVAGSLYSTTLLRMVMDASNGKLGVDTLLQADLITWEIKAIAMVVGAVIAGSGRDNGLKQGLLVGLLVGVTQVGIFLGTGTGTLESSILTITVGLALGLLGGWFGGQMFPPYVPKPATHTSGPAGF